MQLSASRNITVPAETTNLVKYFSKHNFVFEVSRCLSHHLYIPDVNGLSLASLSAQAETHTNSLTWDNSYKINTMRNAYSLGKYKQILYFGMKF